MKPEKAHTTDDPIEVSTENEIPEEKVNETEIDNLIQYYKKADENGLVDKGMKGYSSLLSKWAIKKRNKLESTGRGQRLIEIWEKEMTLEEQEKFVGFMKTSLKLLAENNVLTTGSRIRKKTKNALKRITWPNKWLKLKDWPFETIQAYIATGVLKSDPKIAQKVSNNFLNLLKIGGGLIKGLTHTVAPELAPADKLSGPAIEVANKANQELANIRAEVESQTQLIEETRKSSHDQAINASSGS